MNIIGDWIGGWLTPAIAQDGDQMSADATGRGEAIAASSPGSLLAATAYAAFAALRTQTASTDAETREEAQMYIDQLRETFRRN